ncbi:MAG: acyltransferase family protein [Methanobrevibacter sp.]|nr:acyltransferase family protein [Methanobrevibacter sp.]
MDFVRAIAILTVLYIHATDGIYIISSDAIMNYTIYSRIFNFASLFIGRIGVPFFLMITGYLLLDRSYNDERVRKFWNKNCKGLIIVTVIWAIIYAVSLQFHSRFLPCKLCGSRKPVFQPYVVYAYDYRNVSFNAICSKCLGKF